MGIFHTLAGVALCFASSPAFANGSGTYEECTYAAYLEYNSKQRWCHDTYENGWFGPGGQIERERCLEQASEEWDWAHQQCTAQFPQNMSFNKVQIAPLKAIV